MTNSVFIEGRSWFDKSGGNTYWSAKVWLDGAVLFQTGTTYGYGNAYLNETIEELIKRGYLPPFHSMGELRNHRIALYSSMTPGLKRDMFRAWEPDHK